MIESKGLVLTTIEEEEGRFRIKYMRNNYLMHKEKHFETSKSSYVPYEEKFYELDINDLEEERIFVEAKILLNKKLVRLIDISLGDWLMLKYIYPKYAPKHEVINIITTWFSLALKNNLMSLWKLGKGG